MSVQATTAVWCHSEAEGNERLVLLALADHAHPDGTNARPGLDTLVSMTKISERSVLRHLKSLRDREEIVKTGGGDGSGVSEYSITLPGLGEDANLAPSSKTRRMPAGAKEGDKSRQGGRQSASRNKEEPKEPSEPIGGADAPNAGTAMNKGIPPGFKLPGAIKARLGKEARALLTEGFKEAEVAAAIGLFCRKGGQLSPTVLPSLVMEIRNGSPFGNKQQQRRPGPQDRADDPGPQYKDLADV